MEIEFDKHGPWWTQFIIDGKAYGGEKSYADDMRISQFYRAFPDAQNILELGVLEGGQTMELAKWPDVHIVGIEGRGDNLGRAVFVRDLLGVKNVYYVLADLEEYNLANLKGYADFDTVFCSGLLYHMAEPWVLLEKMCRAAPNIFIWTHYEKQEGAMITQDARYPNLPISGRYHDEPDSKLSGLNPRSYWLTLPSLQAILNELGFDNEVLDDNPKHENGPCVTLIAWKR